MLQMFLMSEGVLLHNYGINMIFKVEKLVEYDSQKLCGVKTQD